MKCSYLSIGYLTLLISIIFNIMGMKYYFFSTLFLLTSLLLTVINLYYSKKNKNKEEQDHDYDLFI